MYCKNCNSYNDDNSRFCCQCGAQLEVPAASSPQSEQTYAAPQNGAPQYSQPNYYAPQGEPTPSLNNTMAIVSIVINIVFFNVIGLIFAILSLTNYNSYESALRAGNIALAEQFKAKSKKFSKVAIVLVIVMTVLAFISGIALVIVLAVTGAQTVDFSSPFTYEYGYESFMMIAPYFG